MMSLCTRYHFLFHDLNISIVNINLPRGQNLVDSVGNLRGFLLLVEGIHAEIWVESEMRIPVEIQGKF